MIGNSGRLNTQMSEWFLPLSAWQQKNSTALRDWSCETKRFCTPWRDWVYDDMTLAQRNGWDGKGNHNALIWALIQLRYIGMLHAYSYMRSCGYSCMDAIITSRMEVLRAGVLPFAGKTKKFQHEHCASRRGPGTHLPQKLHLLLDFSNASCLLQNSEYNPQDHVTKQKKELIMSAQVLLDILILFPPWFALALPQLRVNRW